DPNVGFERTGRGRTASHPRRAIGLEASLREQLARADDDAVRAGIELEHVRGLAERDPEPPALSDGERERAVVPAELAAPCVHDPPVLANEFGGSAPDEAA